MIIGNEHKVTFKVNVMGTSTEPSVKVVLGTEPELSFPAYQAEGGWQAVIKAPIDTKPGKYPMRVEVLVGNRHFSPMTKMVELLPYQSLAAAPPPEKMPYGADNRAPEGVDVIGADSVPDIKLPADPLTVKMAGVAEEVAEEAPSEEPTFDIFLPKTEEVAPPVPTAPRPKKMVKLPADLFKVENLKAPPSAPAPVVRQPIIVRDAVSHTSIDRPVKIAEAKKPLKIVELKHDLPTRLIKGDVVYE